jgi:hypothetical protein
MNPRQLEILQHSLGVDQYGLGPQYRNHFCAGPNNVDHCRALADLGLMREYPPTQLTGGDPLFVVTDEGKRQMHAVSPEPPKRTRSQRRYDAYLAADGDLPFGAWLRTQSARETA